MWQELWHRVQVLLCTLSVVPIAFDARNEFYDVELWGIARVHVLRACMSAVYNVRDQILHDISNYEFTQSHGLAWSK